MNAALLFPGQGAQQVGMMADLAEASPAARRLFQIADEQLGFSLSKVCFTGPAERLNATDVSQPAIFVCSAAALAAMEGALRPNLPAVTMMAGLSLGEYTALYAADAIDFAAALDLVAKRGRYMQQAAEASAGGMVCILGLDEARALELCQAAAAGEVLVPANFNCPGQIVLSGSAGACDRAQALAGQFGASGTVRLKVAGAFHSPFMQPAADMLSEAVESVPLRCPRWPVISNVDARPHGSPDLIKQKLIAQMTSPVRWGESVSALLENGVGAFYEIGPGRVLAGLLRRIDRRAHCTCVNSANAVAKLAGQAVS